MSKILNFIITSLIMAALLGLLAIGCIDVFTTDSLSVIDLCLTLLNAVFGCLGAALFVTAIKVMADLVEAIRHFRGSFKKEQDI